MLVSSWFPCCSDAPAAAGVHVVVGVPAVADLLTSTGVHSVPGVLFIDIITLLLAYRMLPLTTATLPVVCCAVAQPLTLHVTRLKLWILAFTSAMVYWSTLQTWVT